MSIKRNVFISSSTDDLSDERQKLLFEISKLNTEYVKYIPQLSEKPNTFCFREYDMKNSDSVQICLQNVRNCDYYILLIKDNYNYSKKYGCSITELEYKHAKKYKKPIFIFNFNSDNRKKRTKGFIERVKSEKWCYKVDSVDEVFEILSNIIPTYNRSSLIDETIPDGSIVKVDTKLIKRWTLKNTGNVVWENYKLKHISSLSTVTLDKEIIDMPTVYPGDEITLEVEYTCKLEGLVKSIWKMYDKENNLVFPNYLGIWLEIKIIS